MSFDKMKKKKKIDQALIKAIEAYKSSNLEVAKKFAKRIIEDSPGHADANHIIGFILIRKGKILDALPFLKTALESKPSVSRHWFNYIDALSKLDRFSEASEALMLAIDKGAKGQAFDDLYKMLNSPKVKLEIKVQNLKELIAYKPDLKTHYLALADALQEQGKLDEVIEVYKKAIFFNPNHPETYNNLGAALQACGKLDEAIEVYRQALFLKPDYFSAYSNLGAALQEQQKLDEAIEIFNKVLSLKPDFAVAHNNMGNALRDQGKLQQAVDSYKSAVFIKPIYAEAYLNMAIALRDQDKLEEEIEAYNSALSIKHDDVEALYNKSFALLASGIFHEGFKLQELRWQSKNFHGKFLKSSKPFWNGEKNKSVFVWGEQGIGDQIMFASIIPELQKISSKLIVHCDKRLIPLFKRSFSEHIIYCDNRSSVNEGEYDFHTPIGSLALTFRPSLESFKRAPVSFLRHNKVQSTTLRKKILSNGKKTIIGMSWRSEASARGAADRNIGLVELAQTLASVNTQLVCLQYGDVDNEIEILERDFGIQIIKITEIDNFNDVDGLASLIMSCDLIVSTTSATVHLAGALGANVRVLLPFPARWIWGRLGSESPWYKSILPYRQK